MNKRGVDSKHDTIQHNTTAWAMLGLFLVIAAISLLMIKVLNIIIVFYIDNLEKL